MKITLKILALLVGAMAAALAQEPLRSGILENGEIPKGFYRAGIRYGEAKNDSICIRWSRASQADTFWVYRGSSSVEYITTESIRTAYYNQPTRYERRMALHHLRESVLNSPLRFSDMEALSKNQNPQFMKRGLIEYFNP